MGNDLRVKTVMIWCLTDGHWFSGPIFAGFMLGMWAVSFTINLMYSFEMPNWNIQSNVTRVKLQVELLIKLEKVVAYRWSHTWIHDRVRDIGSFLSYYKWKIKERLKFYLVCYAMGLNLIGLVTEVVCIVFAKTSYFDIILSKEFNDMFTHWNTCLPNSMWQNFHFSLFYSTEMIQNKSHAAPKS